MRRALRAVGWDRSDDRGLQFRVLLLMILVLTGIGLVRSTPLDPTDPAFTSPRQSVTWATAQAWADTGRPSISEPRLTTLPNDLGPALTPRDGASAGDEILPKDFPLTVAAYAAALRVNPWIAIALNPLQGLLLLAAVGALSWTLTRDRGAVVVSMLLLLCVPAFWSNASVGVATDVAGAAALLLGLTCLIRTRDHPVLAVAAGALFALAIASRYTHVGPALAAVAMVTLTRTITRRQAVSVLAALAVASVPILLYHQWLYGDPFTTGYALGDALFADRLKFEGRGLLSFNIGRFTSHLLYYGARPETLVLLIGSAVAGRELWKRREGRATVGFAVVMAAALLAYHGGQGTWGSAAFAINASLLRYLLPVIALAAAMAGTAFVRWRSLLSGPTATALLAFLVASSLWAAWTGPGGFAAAESQRNTQRMASDWAADNVPADALIITRLGSKTYFPARSVMTATLMLDGSRVISDREILVWEVVPTVPELADDLVALRQAGQDVYIENDGRPGWLSGDDVVSLHSLLNVSGLDLHRLERPVPAPMYHLVPSEEVRATPSSG